VRDSQPHGLEEGVLNVLGLGPNPPCRFGGIGASIFAGAAAFLVG